MVIYVTHTYTRIRCSCWNDHGGRRTPEEPNWFLPNMKVAETFQQGNHPYSHFRLGKVMDLYFPVLNCSYNGIYTCGIGNNFSAIKNAVTVHVVMAVEPGTYATT